MSLPVAPWYDFAYLVYLLHILVFCCIFCIFGIFLHILQILDVFCICCIFGIFIAYFAYVCHGMLLNILHIWYAFAYCAFQVCNCIYCILRICMFGSARFCFLSPLFHKTILQGNNMTVHLSLFLRNIREEDAQVAYICIFSIYMHILHILHIFFRMD